MAKVRGQPDHVAVLPKAGVGADILALLCPDWRAAMLAVDADTLTVAYANAQALEMFKRRYPLFVSRGCLEISSPHGAQRFQAAMRNVLAQSLSRTAIIVDDAMGGLTYSLRICLPTGFARDVLWRNLDGSSRLVVIEVATGNSTVSTTDLRELGAAFSLTSAETSILALLGQGLSLIEIARRRSVGVETVRHQCKRLLSKTRSRRQSDLVKLVTALCVQEAVVTQE